MYYYKEGRTSMTQPSRGESNAPSNAFVAHVKAVHATGMFRVDEGLTVLALSLNEDERVISLILGGNAISLNASQALDLLQWLHERRDVLLEMQAEVPRKDAQEILLEEQKLQEELVNDNPEDEP
jgi:hypothetical protein